MNKTLTIITMLALLISGTMFYLTQTDMPTCDTCMKENEQIKATIYLQSGGQLWYNPFRERIEPSINE